MWQYRMVLALAVAGFLSAGKTAEAQQHGAMGGGPGMMGMARDSATRALAMGSHQLVMMHERIRRTVTNLPNGVRTLTESDDPHVAALIKEHVRTSVGRLEAGYDPGLPMETPAVRSLFRNSAKIRSASEVTEKGVIVTQTSDDAAVVADLQSHAAEVTQLVERGMAAMHESMMKSGGMGRGMGGGMRGDTTGHHPRPPSGDR